MNTFLSRIFVSYQRNTINQKTSFSARCLKMNFRPTYSQRFIRSFFVISVFSNSPTEPAWEIFQTNRGV